MRVDIIGSAAEVEQKNVAGKNVAVIDVLRATTVMITALMNGATEIVATREVDEAIKHYSKYGKNQAMLGGERNAVRIEGFHLANSPFEYNEETVKGKAIVMTTTNGTRAIEGSLAAKDIVDRKSVV